MMFRLLVLRASALMVLARPVAAQTGRTQAVADTSPVAVVQRQLEGYNAHNVEAFVQPYAEDAVLHLITDPDTVALHGREGIRRTYAFLKQVPREFRVEVVKRIASGPFVVDQERVYGAPTAPAFDPVVIYEVRGGLIRNVWFAQPK
jgi:hypothetical protein